MIEAGALGAEGKQALGRDIVVEVREGRVFSQIGKFPVVEAGPPQALVIDVEGEGVDQVELRAGIGAQANDVARVGRNFGLVEHDMKHG